ncbi:polymerase delta-interacting protein 2 isoform X2 [Hyalella azteca]|uniref:Polymerase delta-interacting protein 2 isoform X2 n=1 Tax=Hyalella azteca TaxID=294128 RepID=A0A8B7N9R6_HYAAZ|nr:polymerase delta-interacting protein 2 isoform X2 [Hyalella azteca]
MALSIRCLPTSKFLRVSVLAAGSGNFSTSINRYFSLSSLQWSAIRLAEVGKFEVPKLSGKYDTGQLFLHRVFGYRGVILFPWIAKVYDRDAPSASSDSSVETSTFRDPPEWDDPLAAPGDLLMSKNHGSPPHEEYLGHITKDHIKGTAHTYYQVLIDSRDCQFLKYTKKAQTEAVTFLGNQENGRTLYAVPGLDYVAHEDVMPYTAFNERPIHHELFYKFLQRVADKDPPFEARDTLKAWQKRNHPWLELSDVHKETTEGVRVTVIPFYMGCREAHSPHSNDVFWWRYCIRLENLGEKAVQLRERHWRIFSLSGTLETVRGRGVVGSEPLLTKRDPAFQYSSHVSLQSPSGHMWGTFRMERADGYEFECRIPPFSLESKQGDSPPPAPAVDS